MAREKLRELLTSKVRTSTDPFRLLPKDLVFALFSYLQPADIIALLEASLLIPLPRVMLKHPIKSHNFFAKPRTVKTLAIPSKPHPNEDPQKDVFVSQLRGGRLIYCYSDGTIGLFSSQSPSTDPIFLQRSETQLPESITQAVHELVDDRIMICLTNNQKYLLDLKNKKSTLQDIPPGKVCSMLASESDSAFLGMENGLLIHWSFTENKSLKCWQFTAPQNINTQNPSYVYIPHLEELTNLDKSIADGLAIYCIARNIDGQFFLVLDVENGYLTCLISNAVERVESIKFIPFRDIKKVNSLPHRVFYTRFGDLTFLMKSAILPYMLRALDDSTTQNDTEICNHEDHIQESAFSFPNGHLVFPCYQNNVGWYNIDQDPEDANLDQICLLEIQQYDTEQNSLDTSTITIQMK
jgi:hypothetical protein